VSISITLTGSTWAEIKAQCRDIIGGPPPAPMAGHTAPAASSLPFPPPGQIPPPNEPQMAPGYSPPVCPEHGHTLKLKPAGISRAGNAYLAGYRCPEQGCRTFVPAPEAVAQ
jgi:hypothetical protein